MPSPATLNVSNDTKIRSDAATTNYGSTAYFDVGESNVGASRINRSLLKFTGLSDGTIPANSIIDSAILNVYDDGNDECSNARTGRVFRTLRAWVESQATWNRWKTLTDWGAAGGFDATDCEQTDIGTWVSPDPPVAGWVAITLTASKVQEMISGGSFTDNGFFLKMDTESNDMHRFTSLDAGANYPTLVITYHAPGAYPKIMVF